MHFLINFLSTMKIRNIILSPNFTFSKSRCFKRVVLSLVARFATFPQMGKVGLPLKVVEYFFQHSVREVRFPTRLAKSVCSKSNFPHVVLEDSLVVFSEDIKKLYKENTTLAVEIHKIHKFVYSFTKRVEVRFQLIESTIEEITCKMHNLSLK